MNRARTLLELQHFDRARDQAMQRLRAVVEQLRGDPEVAASRLALEAAEQELALVERELRSINLERDGLKEHIAREEAKLYGGKVKVPKELQNLQLEVTSLKRRLTELDDTSLELLLRRDEAASNRDNASQRARDVEATAIARDAELATERIALTRKIRSLELKRSALADGVSPADISIYQRLRKAKGGMAVAELRNTACGVCGMELPRSAAHDAQAAAALAHCPGCGRILSA